MDSKKNRKPRENKFPIMVGVKVDTSIFTELELIVEYEKKNGKSPFIRELILDKIRTYEKNPAYLRWKKGRADRIQRLQEREESA